MRTLTSTLAAAQITGDKTPLVKAVFTSGATTKTFDNVTGSGNHHIIDSEETEYESSYAIKLIVEDSDDTLKDLNLEGYSVALSFGNVTSGGSEYSACLTMYCIRQGEHFKQNNVMSYTIVGAPNLMSGEKAEADYIPADSDTNTIKDYIGAIAAPSGALGVTMACYTNYPDYTVDWDSEDSIIDTVTPASGFKVVEGQNRWERIQYLLSLTGCVGRWENDGHLHILYLTNTTTAIISQTTNNTNTITGVGTQSRGQSFTPTADFRADSFTFKLYKVGTLGTLTFHLQKADGDGLPDGTDLATATSNGDTLTELVAGEEREFALSSAIYLKAGTQYTAYIVGVYTTPNRLGYRYNSTSVLANGNLVGRNSATGDWYNEAAQDMYFKANGQSYDYFYSLESSAHKIFSNSYIQSMDIPGYISVKSLKNQNPAYSGYYSASDWATRSDYLKQRDPIRLKVASNDECTSIATAIFNKQTLQNDAGGAVVPMNVGQELYDYVIVYNTVTGEAYSGYVHYIKRKYSPGSKNPYYMEIRFGKVDQFGFLGTVPAAMDDISTGERLGRVESAITTLANLLDQTYFKIGDTDNILIQAAQFIAGTHSFAKRGTWTDNSNDGTPGSAAGYVHVTGASMTYQGVTWNITTMNTNKLYIWWDRTTPTAFQTSDTRPTITADDCLIATNDSGTAYVQILQTLINGNTIITGTVIADTLEATLTLSTTIQTAASGDRVVMDSNGITIYGDPLVVKSDTNQGYFWQNGTVTTITGAAGGITLSTGGTIKCANVVAPLTTASYDFGTSSLKWADGYFSGTIYCANLGTSGAYLGQAFITALYTSTIDSQGYALNGASGIAHITTVDKTAGGSVTLTFSGGLLISAV